MTLPSVLWHCWLGGRQPACKKLSDEALAWSEVQMLSIWSSWRHCHGATYCFIKPSMVWPFWLSWKRDSYLQLIVQASFWCWWPAIATDRCSFAWLINTVVYDVVVEKNIDSTRRRSRIPCVVVEQNIKSRRTFNKNSCDLLTAIPHTKILVAYFFISE